MSDENNSAPAIPRVLLSKIVDEVFDGAIEDPSVIEDIYRVIVREQAKPLDETAHPLDKVAQSLDKAPLDKALAATALDDEGAMTAEQIGAILRSVPSDGRRSPRRGLKCARALLASQPAQSLDTVNISGPLGFVNEESLRNMLSGDAAQCTLSRMKRGKMTTAVYARCDVIAPTQPAQAVTYRSLLAALIDIYDDGQNNAPEDRCYVDGSWKESIDEARAALSGVFAPVPPEGATPCYAPGCHMWDGTEQCTCNLSPEAVKPGIADYYVEGEPVSPKEFIRFLRDRLVALETRSVPAPKLYGSQEEDAHETRCAYVDGWNECRQAVMAIPAPAAAPEPIHASDAKPLRPDWERRETRTHAGWINELLTLADPSAHHREKIPGFARSAMRVIARGLSDTALAVDALTLPPRVVGSLIHSSGVSSYHPDGDQQEKLEALVRATVVETLARLPSSSAAPAADAVPEVELTDVEIDALWELYKPDYLTFADAVVEAHQKKQATNKVPTGAAKGEAS